MDRWPHGGTIGHYERINLLRNNFKLKAFIETELRNWIKTDCSRTFYQQMDGGSEMGFNEDAPLVWLANRENNSWLNSANVDFRSNTELKTVLVLNAVTKSWVALD